METVKSTASIGTEVFSKITASVSHELKNAFAVINENAGLLEDLIHMAPPDQGVDPNRIQKVISAVNKQVARANRILKDVNTFAHSADLPVMEARLCDTVSLVIALARRQADMRKIDLAMNCHEEKSIYTALITFESLLYLILQKLIKHCTIDDTLTIGATISQDVIEVSWNAKTSELPAIEQLLDSDLTILADSLGAAIRRDSSTLILTMPAMSR